MRLQVTAATLLLVACSGACSKGQAADCLAVVNAYSAAMPDASVCDPLEPSPCHAGRPIAYGRIESDGTRVLEGICMPPCLAAVNPSRTAALDAHLKTFEQLGCAYDGCPCPTPQMMPESCKSNGECYGIFAPAP